MCYSDFLPLEETKKTEKIKKGKAECLGIGLVVATLVLSKSIDLCMNIAQSRPISHRLKLHKTRFPKV